MRRYAAEFTHGGGQWLLLTAWLGCITRTGEMGKALACLRWVENEAAEDCCLPEQVSRDLVDPVLYQPWVACWGRRRIRFCGRMRCISFFAGSSMIARGGVGCIHRQGEEEAGYYRGILGADCGRVSSL